MDGRVDAAQRPAPDAVLTVDDPQRREQERHESLTADGEAERPPLLPVAPDRQPLDPPLASTRSRRDAELPRQEREHVGLFRGALADWLADAVAGPTFLVVQDRPLGLAVARRLQQRRHLAGVQGVDPGVALGISKSHWTCSGEFRLLFFRF